VSRATTTNGSHARGAVVGWIRSLSISRSRGWDASVGKIMGRITRGSANRIGLMRVGGVSYTGICEAVVATRVVDVLIIVVNMLISRIGSRE
jgi:hypothetical protein